MGREIISGVDYLDLQGLPRFRDDGINPCEGVSIVKQLKLKFSYIGDRSSCFLKFKPTL